MEMSGELHAQAALPRGKPHIMRCFGGSVGPKAGLDAVEKKNIFSLPGIEPRLLGRQARSVIAILTELSQLMGVFST
jgi:hypothetical protein